MKLAETRCSAPNTANDADTNAPPKIGSSSKRKDNRRRAENSAIRNKSTPANCGQNRNRQKIYRGVTNILPGTKRSCFPIERCLKNLRQYYPAAGTIGRTILR